MRAERSRLAQGRPTLLLAAAGVLLVARIAAEIHESRNPVKVKDLVGWQSPSQASVQQTSKPILYYFSADWCVPCRELNREVLLDTEAATLIRETYVPVKVTDRQQEDGENTTDVATLIERHAVTGFPTLVVARGGTASMRLEGYPGRSSVITFLRKNAVAGATQGKEAPGSGSGVEFRFKVGD
jgi:thiol:disulfide interchange protein